MGRAVARWFDHDGSEYTTEVITPRKAKVRDASYIGADGVEPIVLLELSLGGENFELAVEMSAASAVKIGAALMATDPTYIDELSTLIMSTVAFNMGIGARADRDQAATDSLEHNWQRVRDLNGIVFGE